MVKNLPAKSGGTVDLDLIPGSGENPLVWKMAMQSTILVWKIPCEQRRLVGYSLRGHKKYNMTESTHTNMIISLHYLNIFCEVLSPF